MTITGNVECFQYFNFETNSPKNEGLFLNTEVPSLDECTKIENGTLPYKTALSQANV